MYGFYYKMEKYNYLYYNHTGKVHEGRIKESHKFLNKYQKKQRKQRSKTGDINNAQVILKNFIQWSDGCFSTQWEFH
jgi:hypothetical protein